MGGDHAPEEVVARRSRLGREHATRTCILVGDEAASRAHRRRPVPANVSIVPASESVAMDEHPALAVRRKRDASINVCMRLVKRRQGRRGRDGRTHRRRRRRRPSSTWAGCRGVDRPALAVQMVTDRGPLVLARYRRHDRLDRATISPSTRRWARSLPSGCWASRPHRWLCCRIGEEGGKGEQRVQEATALLKAGDLRFIGNVEGKDLPKHPADVVVCDASVGNVTIKFFEGLSTSIFDMLRAEFKRAAVGADRLPLHAPGHRPHPPALRLRASRRRAAARASRARS